MVAFMVLCLWTLGSTAGLVGIGKLRSVQTMWLRNLKTAIVITLAALIAINSIWIGVAKAEMISTERVIQNSAPSDGRARIEAFLAREDVQNELNKLGIEPQEAADRVTSLTDQEVRQIAGHLEELPAGEGAVGAVVGAAVLIFLVLLITDLLGLTDVFSFVRR